MRVLVRLGKAVLARRGSVGCCMARLGRQGTVCCVLIWCGRCGSMWQVCNVNKGG